MVPVSSFKVGGRISRREWMAEVFFLQFSLKKCQNACFRRFPDDAVFGEFGEIAIGGEKTLGGVGPLFQGINYRGLSVESLKSPMGMGTQVVNRVA